MMAIADPVAIMEWTSVTWRIDSFWIVKSMLAGKKKHSKLLTNEMQMYNMFCVV